MTTLLIVAIGIAGLLLTASVAYALAGFWRAAPVSRADVPPATVVGLLRYLAIVVVGVVVSEAITAGFGRLVQLHSIQRPDRAVYNSLPDRRTAWLTHLSSHFTRVGDTHVIVWIASVIALAVALWLRSPRALLVLGLAVPVAVVLQKQMKHYVHAVKPDQATSLGPVGGFPSGGVLRVLVVAGLVAVLLGVGAAERRRRLLIAAAAAIAYLEAFSRFYLGRHWLVDLLGGLLLGGLLLATFVVAENDRTRSSALSAPVVDNRNGEASRQSAGATRDGALHRFRRA